MEIMYSNSIKDYFKKNEINGFYKDKNDLANYLDEIYGISYDDEWNVKRFLNGIKVKLNDQIVDILRSLGLDESILNKKIKILSLNEFKFVLLAYLLLLNPNVYIFDYFETGLSFSNRKIFVNILKLLKNKDKTVILITNNIGFLLEVCDNIMIVEERKLVYNGKKHDLFVTKKFSDFPSVPPIIDFIRKANKKDAHLLWTMDRKELIKDIYRSLR